MFYITESEQTQLQASINKTWTYYFAITAGVCVCVYGLTTCCYWVRCQGWPVSSLRTPLYPQVECQATLVILDGTQTLVVSRLSKPDSCKASERDLALLGDNSNRWDLVKDQDDEGSAWEKSDGWIVREQLRRHLFCCWSVFHPEQPVNVCRQKQPVPVLVESHELSR